MAKLTYDAGDSFADKLDKIGRSSVKMIVMAGAEQVTREMKKVVGDYHHVGKTGSMQKNVRPGNYHEDLNSGWVEVYPQGNDSRGVSNAKKAFVIDRGIGNNPTKRSRGKKQNKTGDKFITKSEKQFKAGVQKSMQDESERLIAEIFK